MGRTTIAQQLREAWKGSELSLDELLGRLKAEFDIDINISSLSRKLSGNQILTTKEAEALSCVLKHPIVWPPRRSRGAA